MGGAALLRSGLNDHAAGLVRGEAPRGGDVAEALSGDRAAARRLWQREQARFSALAWQNLGDCTSPYHDARRALAILVACRSETVAPSERTLQGLLKALRAIMLQQRTGAAGDVDDAYLETAPLMDAANQATPSIGTALPAPPPPIATPGKRGARERLGNYKERMMGDDERHASRQNTSLATYLPQIGTMGLFALLLGLTISAMVLAPTPAESPRAGPVVARPAETPTSRDIAAPAVASEAASAVVRLETDEPPLAPFRLPPLDEDVISSADMAPVERDSSGKREPAVERAASADHQGGSVPGAAVEIGPPPAPLGQRVGDEARALIHYPHGNAAARAGTQRIAQRMASESYVVADVRVVDTDIEMPSGRNFVDTETVLGRDLREVMASKAVDVHGDEVRLL